MSSLMDRRIAERRMRVREVGARRRLRWLLGFLAIALLVGGSAWLLQSPVLAVRTVTVTGASQSDAGLILAQEGLVLGVPTISVDEAGVVAALQADPWIARAAVTVTWPGTVEVSVFEHRPVAWVAGPEAWRLTSATGAVLAVASAPTDDAPKVEVTDAPAGPGETFGDRLTLGALEFLGALPATAARGAVVRLVDKELYATVGGIPVRLGQPVDMAQKAATLVALIEDGIPPGSLVNLVSALRPAVTPREPST